MLCSKIRITHNGQEAPAGNQRGRRRQASSPERRGCRQIFFAGTGEEGVGLGISWVVWRSTEALRGQQRQGYSDLASQIYLLGSLGWSGAAPKAHGGSNDRGTAIQLHKYICPTCQHFQNNGVRSSIN